jgi:hypothetical protein
MPGRRRCGRALAVAALSAASLIGVGCAKDTTSVLVTVAADSTTPPIRILRTAVARADDPSRRFASTRSSFAETDAADRPGPFAFPLLLPTTLDASLAGPVIVTVEGVDWDTGAVTAQGTVPAVVVAQKQTEASLTLTATQIATDDGGLD